MTYDIISKRVKKNIISITNPNDIFYFLQKYAKSRQEQFLVITLCSFHRVIGIHIATIGLINKTIIHSREIFYHAIKDNAYAIVLAHNHPSGSLLPSPKDIELTFDIINAGKILGFPVVDHIIFNKKTFISLREQGFNFNEKSEKTMKEKSSK